MVAFAELIEASVLLAKHDDMFIERTAARPFRKVVGDPDEVGTWVARVKRQLHGRQITLVSALDIINRPDPKFVIDGLLEDGSFAEFVHASQCGQELCRLVMVIRGRRWLPWLGRDIMGGLAIYVGAEGSGGLGKRLRSLVQGHGHSVPPGDLYIIEQPIDLLDAGSVAEMIQAVERAEYRPACSCWTRMPAAFPERTRTRRRTPAWPSKPSMSCAFVWVAQSWSSITGKTARSSDRGSGALTGAVDTKLRLDANGTKVLPGGKKATDLTLTIEKQKNFEAGEPMRLKLEPMGDSLVPRLSRLCGTSQPSNMQGRTLPRTGRHVA